MSRPCDTLFFTLHHVTLTLTLPYTILDYWKTLHFVERSQQGSGIPLRIIHTAEDSKRSECGVGKMSHLREGLSSAPWSDPGESFAVFTFAQKLLIYYPSKYSLNSSLDHRIAWDPFIPGISFRLTGTEGLSHHLIWNCFVTWTRYKSGIWPMISSHSVSVIFYHLQEYRIETCKFWRCRKKGNRWVFY